MVKLVYRDNNIYLDKYIVIKDVKPKENSDDELILKASIIENNRWLNRAFKDYKIVNFEFQGHYFHIEIYSKKYDTKRVVNFCIWLSEYKIYIA